MKKNLIQRVLDNLDELFDVQKYTFHTNKWLEVTQLDELSSKATLMLYQDMFDALVKYEGLTEHDPSDKFVALMRKLLTEKQIVVYVVNENILRAELHHAGIELSIKRDAGMIQSYAAYLQGWIKINPIQTILTKITQI